MLICLIIKSRYTSERQDTLRYIGRTLDKPNDFLLHMPSIFDYVGGDLVKSIVRLLSSMTRCFRRDSFGTILCSSAVIEILEGKLFRYFVRGR